MWWPLEVKPSDLTLEWETGVGDADGAGRGGRLGGWCAALGEVEDGFAGEVAVGEAFGESADLGPGGFDADAGFQSA